LIVDGAVVSAVSIENVNLREPKDSHEIGRDVIDVEVDIETPDGNIGVWGEGAEKPSRDSVADAQASHSGTVSGTRDGHALAGLL
jgi:hypothetical protein